MFISRAIGKRLAKFLSSPRDERSYRTHKPGQLVATIRKGDVLLVEGTSRISSAIKYLTQSNWSHSAIYIGDELGMLSGEPELVEADINEGVRVVPLSMYASMHTRICRPVGMSEAETKQLLNHIASRVGHQYDLKNIFDLARYFFTTPPVPESWKRSMLSFGSGDPTRAICSSLIAEAFQAMHYPILPDVKLQEEETEDGMSYQQELVRIRHYSLFVPRDFDVSPYFEIIKPTLRQGFDFHELRWVEPE